MVVSNSATKDFYQGRAAVQNVLGYLENRLRYHNLCAVFLHWQLEKVYIDIIFEGVRTCSSEARHCTYTREGNTSSLQYNRSEIGRHRIVGYLKIAFEREFHAALDHAFWSIGSSDLTASHRASCIACARIFPPAHRIMSLPRLPSVATRL